MPVLVLRQAASPPAPEVSVQALKGAELADFAKRIGGETLAASSGRL
jgi:hypothetical protein